MVVTGAPIQMPDEINDVELDVSMHGLGHIVSSTHVLTAGLRTRQRIYPTVVDAERGAIYGVNNIMKMLPDPGLHEGDRRDLLPGLPLRLPPRLPHLGEQGLHGSPAARGRRRADRALPPLVAAVLRRRPEGEGQPVAAEAAAPAPTERRTLLDRVGQWARRLPTVGPLAETLSSRFSSRVAPSTNGVPAGRVAADVDEALPGKALGKPMPVAQATQRFGSVDAYFKSLEARFDPGAAGDLDAVFQWVLTGDEARSHFVEIKAGNAQASAGTHPAPTVAIEMSTDDYLRLINGELNGAMAFSTGRGKLRGPVRLAMKMQRIFPLDRAV